MSDEASPSSPAPAPPKPPVPTTATRPPGPPARRVPINRTPTPPGPLAGHPVGPVVRNVPPGIPAGAESLIQTQGSPAPAAAAAPTVQLHPSFAPLSPEMDAAKAHATRLRNTLISLVTQGTNGLKAIDEVFEKLNAAPPQVLAAEGIDLDRVRKFREGLADLLRTTHAEG